ncbi:unnamed protein product [Brassica oleracea var. botrytis]
MVSWCLIPLTMTPTTSSSMCGLRRRSSVNSGINMCSSPI